MPAGFNEYGIITDEFASLGRDLLGISVSMDGLYFRYDMGETPLYDLRGNEAFMEDYTRVKENYERVIKKIEDQKIYFMNEDPRRSEKFLEAFDKLEEDVKNGMDTLNLVENYEDPEVTFAEAINYAEADYKNQVEKNQLDEEKKQQEEKILSYWNYRLYVKNQVEMEKNIRSDINNIFDHFFNPIFVLQISSGLVIAGVIASILSEKMPEGANDFKGIFKDMKELGDILSPFSDPREGRIMDKMSHTKAKELSGKIIRSLDSWGMKHGASAADKAPEIVYYMNILKDKVQDDLFVLGHMMGNETLAKAVLRNSKMEACYGVSRDGAVIAYDPASVPKNKKSIDPSQPVLNVVSISEITNIAARMLAEEKDQEMMKEFDKIQAELEGFSKSVRESNPSNGKSELFSEKTPEFAAKTQSIIGKIDRFTKKYKKSPNASEGVLNVMGIAKEKLQDDLGVMKKISKEPIQKASEKQLEKNVVKKPVNISKNIRSL